MIGFHKFFKVASTLSGYLLLSTAIVLLTNCKKVYSPQNDTIEDAKKEELHLLIKSASLPNDVVDIFSRETGIPIRIQVCDSDGEMERIFEKSPETYDVLQPGEGLAAEWVTNGKLASLPYEDIPNLKNLDSCLNLPFDPSNRYTVPYFGGIMGILYNSAQVQDEIRDYNDIFNPKYAGRIYIPNDNREIVASAMAQLNIRFNQVTSSNLEAIRKQLTAWLPLIGKYSPQVPARTVLRRGDAVAALMRSGDAITLMQEDPQKFKWIVPDIGAHLFIESWALSANSPRQAEAKKFINFLLRPDISAKISRQYPYLNPNQAARSLLPKEAQRCLCLLPQDFPKSGLQSLPALNSDIFQSLEDFVKGIRPK